MKTKKKFCIAQDLKPRPPFKSHMFPKFFTLYNQCLSSSFKNYVTQYFWKYCHLIRKWIHKFHCRQTILLKYKFEFHVLCNKTRSATFDSPTIFVCASGLALCVSSYTFKYSERDINPAASKLPGDIISYSSLNNSIIKASMSKNKMWLSGSVENNLLIGQFLIRTNFLVPLGFVRRPWIDNGELWFLCMCGSSLFVCAPNIWSWWSPRCVACLMADKFRCLNPL